MVLEQWANVAEVVGVIGLIVSLLYVAQQVRLNREQLQSDAASRYYEKIYDVFKSVALDREFADIWRKGADELDSLDDTDRLRATLWEVAALNLWAQWYSEMRQNLLPRDVDTVFRSFINNVGDRQAVREAWKLYKNMFDDSFQQYMGRFLD